MRDSFVLTATVTIMKMGGNLAKHKTITREDRGMAYLNNIWVFNPNDKTPTMRVFAGLKPDGEVKIEVPLPPKFLQAIVDVAQTAADAHEALMRAEILGDQSPTPAKSEEV